MIRFANLRSVVCLGAHPDDIEIGAGGTLLQLMNGFPEISFRFLIFTATEERAAEAKESAADLLGGLATVEIGHFDDRTLPYAHAAEAKRWLASNAGSADLVLTPTLEDRHQDHRFVSELAWQTYRRTPILEYEIPKWEGDRPETNLFVPLTDEIVGAKVEHLATHFPSQHDKPWYGEDLFRSVARLRGMEAGARFAEGFVARKLVLGSEQAMAGSFGPGPSQ